MQVLLVLCDTQGSNERIERLVRALGKYGDSFAISDSAYLLRTEASSERVFDGLRKDPELRQSESLLVLTMAQPYTGRAPARVLLWLQQAMETEHVRGNPVRLIADIMRNPESEELSART